VPDREELLERLAGAHTRLARGAARGLERHRERLDRAHDRLRRGPALLLERKRSRLDHAAAQLRALAPRATLERGYAIVHLGETIVRWTGAVRPGDAIAVEVADGKFAARVD
jgi:exodeoxyribonuclease VII large subunit